MERVPYTVTKTANMYPMHGDLSKVLKADCKVCRKDPCICGMNWNTTMEGGGCRNCGRLTGNPSGICDDCL